MVTEAARLIVDGNAIGLALVVGFVSGLFGADSIGLFLIRLGTFIRRRGK